MSSEVGTIVLFGQYFPVFQSSKLLFDLSGPTQKMNLFQSITSALDNTLANDPTAGGMPKKEFYL